MRKFIRTETPELLKNSWEEFGNNYALKKSNNPSHVFRWPIVNGKKLNQLLLPFLKDQTQHHCSYCDGFPLGPADETIDHFKPKSNSLYYFDVCHWQNLYVACADCQKMKKDQFNELLLRPDEPDFVFSKYFVYNYQKHKIEVRPDLDEDVKSRAEITLGIFRFNESAYCKSRQISFERYISNPRPDIDDYAFRFMFD